MNDAGDPSRYWLDSRIKKLQQGCGRVNVSDQVKKDLARPWSRTASSSASGASSWQPGHPVAARDSPRRMNLAVVPYATSSHRARTPGRPVRAKLGHATSRAQPHSAHFTACRAALLYAPISLDLTRSRQVAPPSRSKLALNSRSVPPGVCDPGESGPCSSSAAYSATRPFSQTITGVPVCTVISGFPWAGTLPCGLETRRYGRKLGWQRATNRASRKPRDAGPLVGGRSISVLMGRTRAASSNRT